MGIARQVACAFRRSRDIRPGLPGADLCRFEMPRSWHQSHPYSIPSIFASLIWPRFPPSIGMKFSIENFHGKFHENFRKANWANWGENENFKIFTIFTKISEMIENLGPHLTGRLSFFALFAWTFFIIISFLVSKFHETFHFSTKTWKFHGNFPLFMEISQFSLQKVHFEKVTRC